MGRLGIVYIRNLVLKVFLIGDGITVLFISFKIVKGFCPEYLASLLPPKQFSYNDDRNNLYRKFRAFTDYFGNSFFPYCVNEWNSKLGEKTRNIRSISKFKDKLLDFIRPKMNLIYGIHDPHGLRLLTRLRLKLSHLREHKFRHNFRDTINPLCSRCNDVESTSHYLLRCSLYASNRQTLYDNIKEILGQIPNPSDDNLVVFFLYGKDDYKCRTKCFCAEMHY